MNTPINTALAELFEATYAEEPSDDVMEKRMNESGIDLEDKEFMEALHEIVDGLVRTGFEHDPIWPTRYRSIKANLMSVYVLGVVSGIEAQKLVTARES